MSDTPSTSDVASGCGVCAAPCGDDGYLCKTHTDDLTADLTTAPALVVDLDVTITRQARLQSASDGGRSTERPLPWNEHASSKAFELNTTLNAWALDTSRVAEDERDQLIHVHHSDTAAVAEWLGRNISTLRRHPEAGTAHDEITNAIREARRAIDRPAEQAAYGPCHNTGDPDQPHGPCPAYLYGPPGKPVVTCRACGAHHDTTARRQWMLDYTRDMLGTATEVAGYLRVAGVTTTPDAVRALASRDRIIAVAEDARARPLYRYSDVIAAISDKYKRRPKAA